MTNAKRYTKKPKTVQAMQWDGNPDSVDDILEWCGEYTAVTDRSHLYIYLSQNNGAELSLNKGDYLVYRNWKKRPYVAMDELEFERKYGEEA